MSTAMDATIPADVYDRILARVEAAIFAPAPVLAVVREFVHVCESCGTTDRFVGTDAQWANRRVVFADTHECGGGDCE